MRGLASECKMAVFAIKLCAVFYEFGDVARPLLDKDCDRFRVAQPRARVNRVLIVKLNRIVIA